MNLRQFKTTPYFIVLLLTIFITNNVYASGMMLTCQLSINNTGINETHHHDDMILYIHHDADAELTHSQNENCTKCEHCIACFTVLPPSLIATMQFQTQAPTISLFEPHFLSHISAQPQRPPIS